MAEKKKDDSIDPVKLGGAVLAAIAGVVILINRMPHMGYVEVHEDAPRSARREPAAPPKAPEAPKPAAPTPTIVAPAPKPAPVLAAKPQLLGVEVTSSVEPDLGIRTTDEVGEACSGELGLLCYQLGPNQWRSCLTPYKSALRLDCRRALKAWKN
jgi:hypothetical protein